jgi:cytochrome P450
MLQPEASVFTRPTFCHMRTLVFGTLVASGRRIVTAALRAIAQAPVFAVKLPTKERAWLVTRYDDVLSVLKDERFAKDRRNAMSPEQLKKQPWIPPMFKPLERNMLDLDSPDHTRLRALVHQAFTPRLIEQMREQIQTLTNELWMQ